ncbi:MAG TPA: hypothetical protein DDW54_02210 [Clostridiales bacterium]|nr:hypothetical protein [Clostridiales bacterium]
MADYNVQITEGAGSAPMKKGNYSVTAMANGYEATTLSPSTYTAADTEGTGAFTISANGVLTIVFNETGAAGGTPVISGSVVMTDATGATQYGSPVNISATGEAVFNNVPYSSETPYVLHFVQLATDDGHNLFDGVITVNLSSENQTEYVVNSPIATQNITLADANYSGLPVAGATLVFTGEQ